MATLQKLLQVASILLTFSRFFPCVLCADTTSTSFAEGLQTQIHQQTSQIQALQALVQQQASSIQGLQALLEQQREASQIQAVRIASLQSKVSDVQDRLAASESKIQRLQYRVTFTALFNDGGPITLSNSSSPLVFSLVLANIGNAYDRLTGVFTAPVSGVYLFLVSLRADRSLPTLGFVELALVQVGKVVAIVEVQLDDAAALSRGVAFAAVHAAAGDTVYVRHYRGQSTVDGWWNTAFSGMLLYAD